MLYYISTVLSSVAAAKIMVYTSRMAFSILLLIWTMVCLFFMMFWTKEPSYSIILATCIWIGVSSGSWPALGSSECMHVERLFDWIKCAKQLHIFFIYGRRQKKFRNHKMVKLQLRSNMNSDFVDISRRGITVLKQRNYRHPRSNYASDMQRN